MEDGKALSQSSAFEQLLREQRKLAKEAQQQQQQSLKALQEESRRDMKRLEDKLEAQVQLCGTTKNSSPCPHL